MQNINHLLSVAPMMDVTDKHCRYFLRLLSPHCLLYSEMLTTGAVLHGDKSHLLGFHPLENPVVLQLGGSNPNDLAQSAKIGEQWGYQEINLNVGCPSDRVQQGRFGACLMKEAQLVATCLKAMRDAVTIPVTIKTRLGVDNFDDYAFLCEFVDTIITSGVDTFIIHARKAWLKGLSPKENRDIPPLMYQRVYQLKNDFPQLNIIINGGITTREEVLSHLQFVDGVMLGRAALNNPYLLTDCERVLFQQPLIERKTVLSHYFYYITQQLKKGEPLGRLLAPLYGLYKGEEDAKMWRRQLSHMQQQKQFNASELSTWI